MISGIPEREHWAIIEEVNVTIPGDERSRTNPGHGYPEYTETYHRYSAFTTKEKFEEELVRRASSGSVFANRKIMGVHVTETFRTVMTTIITSNSPSRE